MSKLETQEEMWNEVGGVFAEPLTAKHLEYAQHGDSGWNIIRAQINKTLSDKFIITRKEEPLPEFTHPDCRHVCQETEGLKGTPAEGANMCDDGCVWYQSPSSKLAGIIEKYLPDDVYRKLVGVEMHSEIMKIFSK